MQKLLSHAVTASVVGGQKAKYVQCIDHQTRTRSHIQTSPIRAATEASRRLFQRSAVNLLLVPELNSSTAVKRPDDLR